MYGTDVPERQRTLKDKIAGMTGLFSPVVCPQAIVMVWFAPSHGENRGSESPRERQSSQALVSNADHLLLHFSNFSPKAALS
jgi:hypothetical protein